MPKKHTPGTTDPLAAWQRHRRLVRLGQLLLAVGGLVMVVHLVMHLSGSPSGWTDLTVGYPTGAVLALIGAVLAGRADPGKKAR